jgi:hypothetical protein
LSKQICSLGKKYLWGILEVVIVSCDKDLDRKRAKKEEERGKRIQKENQKDKEKEG